MRLRSGVIRTELTRGPIASPASHPSPELVPVKSWPMELDPQLRRGCYAVDHEDRRLHTVRAKENAMRQRTRWVAWIALGLGTTLASAPSQAAETGGKRPLNIILIICDQETYRLAADDYQLPARLALRDHGVTSRNHSIGCGDVQPFAGRSSAAEKTGGDELR